MSTKSFFSVFLLYILVLVTPAFASGESEQAKGQFLGAKDATHPQWFKESFLDFGDDIEEAATEGKRLALYFWQAGCPYCNLLWERNMAVESIEQQFSSGFDVVAINMWGDQEVITVGGRQFTEKQLARALDVDFTPTLLFYDEKRKIVLRLNGYLPPERFKLALNYASGAHDPGQSFNQYIASHSSAGKGLTRGQSFFGAADELLYDRKQTPGNRPLAVLFETANCTGCDTFHELTLAHTQTRDLFQQMDVVQLDANSEVPLMLPDGRASSPREWVQELGISYYPSIVFFDETGEQVMLMDAYFRNFHTQSIFAYVLEKAYLEQPSFQRYISARAEHLNEQGIDVDIWEE